MAEHEKEVDIDLPDVILIGHKISLVLPDFMLPYGSLDVCTLRNIAIAKATGQHELTPIRQSVQAKGIFVVLGGPVCGRSYSH